MRMWLVNPETMCRKHLLGEHYELHMLSGSLLKGRSIQGHLEKGNLEPSLLHTRHSELVGEMTRRGMHHRSPLPAIDVSSWGSGYVDPTTAEAELRRRCGVCRELGKLGSEEE